MIRTILNSVSVNETGTEPVTVSKAKTYLGIASTVHDTLLGDLVVSAREDFEKESEMKVIDSTVMAYYDSINEYTYLPLYPVTTVTSVKDEDDVNLTYTLTKGTNPKLKITRDGEVVVVYGIVANVTEDIELAIIKKVAEDFEYRTGIMTNPIHTLPNNWKATALNYRRTWLM